MLISSHPVYACPVEFWPGRVAKSLMRRVIIRTQRAAGPRNGKRAPFSPNYPNVYVVCSALCGRLANALACHM